MAVAGLNIPRQRRFVRYSTFCIFRVPEQTALSGLTCLGESKPAVRQFVFWNIRRGKCERFASL
jgi:hypothetical protein